MVKGIRLSFHPDKAEASGISSFSCLTTTLAATLGTGNIIGLSLAVASGGPGAVFWCWLTGVLGMASSYAESYICVKYKRKDCIGGPMDVLTNKLGHRTLGKIYALGIILCSMLTSAAIQSRAITDVIQSTAGTPEILCGGIIALLVLITLLGGNSAVHRLCMKLVPAMAGLFITCIIVSLVHNFAVIPQAVKLIIEGAFSPVKCLCGVGSYSVGSALRQGIARGIFTNEAGLGTSAIPATETENTPHTQGLISMSATFWDTVVLCGITGIAIVSCMISSPASFYNIAPENYINIVFNSLGCAGNICLNISIIIFAFATLIGWAHFGSIACCWFQNPVLIQKYPWIYSAMCMLGSCLNISRLFMISDLVCVILLFCNAVMLITLRKDIVEHRTQILTCNK